MKLGSLSRYWNLNKKLKGGNQTNAHVDYVRHTFMT